MSNNSILYTNFLSLCEDEQLSEIDMSKKIGISENCLSRLKRKVYLTQIEFNLLADATITSTYDIIEKDGYIIKD